MENTYKIIAKTNGYIASRDPHFKGRTETTIAEGMTLREAQAMLTDMFNKDYDTCYKNWGVCRMTHPYYTSSFRDGTRSYEYDSRTYSIETDNQ